MSAGALTVAERLADHNARIEGLETGHTEHHDGIKELGKKVDRLLFWIMGVLATAGAGLLVQVIKH